MNIHEYQAKQLFREHGIPVPVNTVITSADGIEKAIAELGTDKLAVKAQVHAGGRGKAGGVKICQSKDAVTDAVNGMLGETLVTHQTGPEGLPINTVMLETLTDIQSELYLSLLVDRDSRSLSIIASSEGGMDIEEVAESTPEKVITLSIGNTSGLQPFHSRKIGFALGLDGALIKQLHQFLSNMIDCFYDIDASLVEINPLVVTGEQTLIALDCKINIDDNALYRRPNVDALRDVSQEDERESQAEEHELNYVALDGNIGCMVNGAGLAMGTMDLIKHNGGNPANFLDVGGGATAERVAEAFKIILSDSNVKTILVNIFGGIVRCDLIANGIIQAAQETDIQIPVVVRLEGTNAEEGRRILDESDIGVRAAATLSDAATMAVEIAEQTTGGAA